MNNEEDARGGYAVDEIQWTARPLPEKAAAANVGSVIKQKRPLWGIKKQSS
jgi:hypothetical protein